MKMKNVFVRTALALPLIFSWISVETAEAGAWTLTPGESVGQMIEQIQVGGVIDRFLACKNGGMKFSWSGAVGLGPSTDLRAYNKEIRYMQFKYTIGLDGTCYYYKAGSSGKGGPHTWRWDD